MTQKHNCVELVEGWLHFWELGCDQESFVFSHGHRPAPKWAPKLCVFRSDTAVFSWFESEQSWTSEYEKEFSDETQAILRTRLDGGVGRFHSRWGYRVPKKRVADSETEAGQFDSEEERGSPASTPTSVKTMGSSRKSSTDSSHHSSSNSSRRGSVLMESTRSESLESVSTTVWLVNFFIKKGSSNSQKAAGKSERKSSGSSLIDLSRITHKTRMSVSRDRLSSGPDTTRKSKEVLTRWRFHSEKGKHKAKDSDERALLNSKDKSARSYESVLASAPGMPAIDLSAPHVEVKPLHSSVLGQSHCIQLATPQGSKYISCTTSEEMDKWLSSIRRRTNPQDEQSRRVDSSLKIWIVEAKNITPKRRYFCDILIDQTLYAKTSIKTMTEMLFWGEHFELKQLPPVETITVNLYREADKKKKKEKNMLVGYINLTLADLENRQLTEKWITCQSGTVGKAGKDMKGEIPIIRIKARKQTVDILPIEYYQTFIKYLRADYKELCRIFEPLMAVKEKEDFATCLVHILQTQGKACEFLADIVVEEISRLDDEHLTFRGNSIATKAMEAYMKLVGGKYLYNTLGDLINQLVQSPDDCEVDPTKVATPQLLTCQQTNLDMYSNMAWVKITNSFCYFPNDLREVFSSFRARCTERGKGDYSDNLISGCIFLRFLCPAILYPSLFNLTQEYPNERASRNLTLIAKTIQTLANFNQFGIKEEYMTFMNAFVGREEPNMKTFLYKISSGDSNNHFLEFDGHIDLGKELSVLHAILLECIAKYSPTAGDQFEELKKTLSTLTESFADPTIGLTKIVRKSQAYDNMLSVFPQSPQPPPDPQPRFRDTTLSFGKISKRSYLSPSDALTDSRLSGQSTCSSSCSEDPEKTSLISERRIRASLEPPDGFPSLGEAERPSGISGRRARTSLDSPDSFPSLGDNESVFDNSLGNIKPSLELSNALRLSGHSAEVRNSPVVRPNQINIERPNTETMMRKLSGSDAGMGDYEGLLQITRSDSQAVARPGVHHVEAVAQPGVHHAEYQPQHPLAFANPLFGHLQPTKTKKQELGALTPEAHHGVYTSHAKTVQRESSDSSNSSDDEATPWQVKLARTSSPLAEPPSYGEHLSMEAAEQFESFYSTDSGQSSFSNASFYTCSSDNNYSMSTGFMSPISPTQPYSSPLFDGAINGCSTFPRRQRAQPEAPVTNDPNSSSLLQRNPKNIPAEEVHHNSTNQPAQSGIPFNRQLSTPNPGWNHNTHLDPKTQTSNKERTNKTVHTQQRNIPGSRSVPEGFSSAVQRVNQLRSITDHLRSLSSKPSPENSALTKERATISNNVIPGTHQSPDSSTLTASQSHPKTKSNPQALTSTITPPEGPGASPGRAQNPPSSITKSPGWQIALKMTRPRTDSNSSSRDSSPQSMDSSPRNSTSSTHKSSSGISISTPSPQPFDHFPHTPDSSISTTNFSKPKNEQFVSPNLQTSGSSQESPVNSRGSSNNISQNQTKLDNSPHKFALSVFNGSRQNLAETKKKSSSFDSSLVYQPPSFLVSKYAAVRAPAASLNQRLTSDRAISFHALGETTKSDAKSPRPFPTSRSIDLGFVCLPEDGAPNTAATSEPALNKLTEGSSIGLQGFSTPGESCTSNRETMSRGVSQDAANVGVSAVMKKLQEQEREKVEFEKEAHVLRQQLLAAQEKLHETELRLLDNEMDTQAMLDECKDRLVATEETMRRQQAEKDESMKAIIDRLQQAEEELKKEHEEMVKVVEHKQQVIEVQELRIQNLDLANKRLLRALADLQGRESTHEGSNFATNCNGVMGNGNFAGF